MQRGNRDSVSTTQVAPSIYRGGSSRINWYVIDTPSGVTVIDTGAPKHWEQFTTLLDCLEKRITTVDAVLLTHAHPDHMGFAERLRETADCTVYTHEFEESAVKKKPGIPFHLLQYLHRPAVLKLLYEGFRTGLVNVKPVSTVTVCSDGDNLPVPGQLTAIHLPGHTTGHCGFWYEPQNVLFSGDALVTLNLLTGKPATPRAMPATFNFDDAAAHESLSRTSNYGTVTLLPGHGDPWTGDLTTR